MISVESALKTLDFICECDPEIRVKCPACLAGEVLLFVSEKLDEVSKKYEKLTPEAKSLRDTVRNMVDSHNIHVEALQHYYHLTHKNCPCMIQLEGVPSGICGSPFKGVSDPTPKKLTRDEELEQIDIYMEQQRKVNAR